MLSRHRYFKCFGGVITWTIVFVLVGGWTAANILSTMWLSDWVNAGDRTVYYAVVYTVFVVGMCVITSLRGFAVSVGAVRAATTLHERLLNSIMYAKMKFFDTELTVRLLLLALLLIYLISC